MQEFSYLKNAGKGLTAAVIVAGSVVIAGYARAHGLDYTVAVGGFKLELTNEASVAAALAAGAHMLRNWLKIKWPEKFSWL